MYFVDPQGGNFARLREQNGDKPNTFSNLANGLHDPQTLQNI